MPAGVVRLDTRPGAGSDAAELLDRLHERASRAATYADPVGEALVLAVDAGPDLPLPGEGRTALLWEALATLGAADLTVARALEPHVDALAVLAQAGLAAPGGATFGVYAAEGPGTRLEAERRDDGVVLTGRKPWCSLGDRVSHALVTAWVDASCRGLFLVDLGGPGVRPDPASAPWVARGLAAVTSGGLELTEVPAEPVGGPGWYLERPGFAWGGIGVAAVWFGGAVGVARRVHAALLRREPDQLGLAHLGALDVALSSARASLADAAAVVDAGQASGEAGELLALRVRTVVAGCVEQVLRVADHALGPAPLALEEEHARRVDDLRLYVRQHHAERDEATLGRAVLGQDASGAGWSWW